MKHKSNQQNRKPIALPDGLLRQDDGVFVDVSQCPSASEFANVVNSLFTDGARFEGLDYSIFSGLLYDFDRTLVGCGNLNKLRLANEVVDFSSDRRALYKAVKLDADNRHAVYFFEPVEIETVVEEPVYGEEAGVQVITSMARKKVRQATRLDLDEFITDMWLKGVRYGLDVETVNDVIVRGKTVRMEIAAQLDAIAGADAEIEEACDALHRDNSPKLLLNGKADLRKFQDRFPQIAQGARLLKKKNRVLGCHGYTVSGELIPVDLPQDAIDLSALAGTGTRVEIQDGCEYIVASQDGFLSLSLETNHIAVTESIENKAGVSLKTTGDLLLAGNEFIEHGEVQEGRVVEGKNMTFHSDVYGDVISQGGFILLEANLSGGSAKSYGGDVTSSGRAFNSVIEACSGQVNLHYAESCLIVGESVVIDRAVNCEIVAKELQIGTAEGCNIAGLNIQINSSGARRGKETLIFILVPDLSVLEAQIQQMNSEVEGCNKIVAAKEAELVQLKSDAEFAKYLALATSIRQGKIQLNAVQQDGWQKMTARFAGQMGTGSRLTAEKREQVARAQVFIREQAHLLAAREKLCENIGCEITAVAGDTRVQSRIATLASFQQAKPSEIRARLREQDIKFQSIFSNDSGAFKWNFHDRVAFPA